jgi:uncharacterized protein DUF3185
MNKTVISLVLLSAGITFLIFGVIAMHSASSDISRFFTGAPTDKATWLMMGGAVMTISGVAGLLPWSNAR